MHDALQDVFGSGYDGLDTYHDRPITEFQRIENPHPGSYADVSVYAQGETVIIGYTLTGRDYVDQHQAPDEESAWRWLHSSVDQALKIAAQRDQIDGAIRESIRHNTGVVL